MTDRDENLIAERFRAFIERPDFPCVGAKSALGKGQMTHLVLNHLACPDEDQELLEAFGAFVKAYRREPLLFTSFAVSWRGPLGLDEATFEALLWTRLQALHRLDANEHGWDPRVDSDPESPHFSFSLGGEAFFVVGLHNHSSRLARRFAYPTMVFNLHDQFEKLREEQIYDRLHAKIIERDTALQGEPNPMLAKHGEAPAARQYSGRAVDQDWSCPFAPQTEKAHQ